MQNLTFYVAGVLVIAFVAGLHADVGKARRGRTGHVLLWIGGAALAVNGAFSWKVGTFSARLLNGRSGTSNALEGRVEART